MPRVDYLHIGSSPYDEDCAQVGSDNYRARARVELQTFIAQLRREYGSEPDRASLRIKWSPHDFGTYGEVVCYYDTEDEAAVEYAFAVEAGEKSDGRWDLLSRQALAEAGFPVSGI